MVTQRAAHTTEALLWGRWAAQLNSQILAQRSASSALVGYINFNSEFGSSHFVFRFLFLVLIWEVGLRRGSAVKNGAAGRLAAVYGIAFSAIEHG